MEIFLVTTAAFLIVMALSYVVLFLGFYVLGAFVAIVGYFCRKDVTLGLNDFYKSKGYKMGLIFVFVSGLLCALVDLSAAKGGLDGLGFFSSLILLTILYLCGLLAYFIFKNDR